jgi:AcrR family transcriptional regulator
MPKVSAEHKDAVRRRILEAALVCLERNGYQDVTTRELLSEAGLSTGTFYNYFPSKEHLYETLAEEALGSDVARILAGRADGVPVAQGLLSFVQDYVFADQTGAIAISSLRSRMHAGPEAAEAVTRLNQYVVEALTPLVRNSVEEGYLRADVDPEALVELVDLVWDGMGRRAAQDTFQTSYARVARALLQVLLDGAVSPGQRRDFPNA